jgi:hypothetical protein
MPQVWVTRDKTVSDDTLQEVARVLPDIIARYLSVDGFPTTSLAAKDIDIDFHDAGPFDVRSRSLQILIFANEYEPRIAQLKGTSTHIIDDLCRLVVTCDLRGRAWGWVRLAPGDFSYGS